MVIGARTSMGKTAFVMQMANDCLMAGKSILYVSFEMTADDILERLFCLHADIDNYELLRGGFSKYTSEWLAFEEFISEKRFVISHGFGQTWDDVDAFFKDIKSVPDVVIVDYIQAIHKVSSHGKEFIDEYIKKFRDSCIQNNFCGILISQINRSAPDSRDKAPQLHQLKGSGFLEELADQVLLLDWNHRSSGHADKGLYTINVAKNRLGRTGFVKATFIPEFYKFVPYQESSVEVDEKATHRVDWND